MSRIFNTSSSSGKFIGLSQCIALTLVFIIGVGFSIAIRIVICEWENAETQRLFEYSARNRLASLNTDMLRHQEIVNSIAGLFSSSERVSTAEFKGFTADALARHRSIQGLSWNPLITLHERNAFIQKVRAQGYQDFEISELDESGNLIKAKQREDYVPVELIEPYVGNRDAMGFNISSDSARLDAIHRARDTGRSIITERIKLVQKKDKNFGYLLLRAVYKKGSSITTQQERRASFIGLAVGVFSFSDWVPEAKWELPPVGIDLLLMDMSATADKQLLHYYPSRTNLDGDLPTAEQISNMKKGLHWQTSINILGREWSFLFTPAEEFLLKQHHWHSKAFLVAGLLFTFLLTFYLYSKALYVAKLKHSSKILIAAHDEAKRANEFKSKFLARMSHELRTPMNAILGFGQLLKLSDEKLDEVQKENVNEILAAGSHLLNLINELLDLSRIESGKMQIVMSEISLSDVIKECISLITPQAEVRGMKIIDEISEKDIAVHADFTRLKQVLINLLSNAIKYGHEKTEIILSCEIKNDNYINITITNKGDGISETDSEKLFVSFERLSEAKHVEGTGIGLVITKYLVELMDGEIGVNSKLGESSTFWIDIKWVKSV